MDRLSCNELVSLVGSELGLSDWVEIDQPRIDQFAKATDDYEGVHVDRAAARAAGFDDTIAHGFLTLSMLMRLQRAAVPDPKGIRTGFNYGFDRLRFTSPVPVGARIRGRFTLVSMEEVATGRWRRTMDTMIEIENQSKPALSARWIAYFIV